MLVTAQLSGYIRLADFAKPAAITNAKFSGGCAIRVFWPFAAQELCTFWSSDLIASVGQFVREVALYWLTYEITRSPWALRILGFREAAPSVV